MTAIVRTFIASVDKCCRTTFRETKAVLIYAMVVFSSHGKTYLSHGVCSEGDER